MKAPDPMRLLFFASETAVIGVVVATYVSGSQAVYVRPMIPVFLLGGLGLFAASVWFHERAPGLARAGYATLVLTLFWVYFAQVILL